MFNTQILAGSSGQGGETQQSLKFNDDESQYLSWTPASAGNRKTWTWSAWVKRGNLGGSTISLFASRSGSAEDTIRFDGPNSFNFYVYNSGYVGQINTTSVYRDVSAWYHIVCVWDTTNATSTDRMRLYVNGERVSAFNTANYPSLNADSRINSNVSHSLGQNGAGGEYFDGYLSDVYFIDGQALDASSFGQFTNGYWEKKDYSGTYGTNGFHLTFQDDVVSEGFNTVTYRGNSGTQSISGLGFSPDLVWIKNRGTTAVHVLQDSVRGSFKYIQSDNTAAENTTSGNDWFRSFDGDGFTVSNTNTGGTATSEWNAASNNYVAWAWDAGSGSPVSNTDGSITSTVKANPSYGFSIVSYTASGNASDTVGHGLSSAPEVLILKDRDASGDWYVYTTAIDGSYDSLRLNSTNAKGDSGQTAPTNSVFGSGYGSTNDIIAYCFHSVAGYSSIGSYSGTDSAGVTVTTGFRPAFVMIKATNIAENWVIIDNTRNPANPANSYLNPNTSSAEVSSSAFDIEFTDTGFVLNGTDDAINGYSGGTGEYIYMAFADTREAAFWKDVSGQGNHWTPNNLDYRDSLIDSPANNFAVMNQLDKISMTLSEGNLRPTPTGDFKGVRGSFAIPLTGKWFFEARVITGGGGNITDQYIGIATDQNVLSGTSPYPQEATYGVVYKFAGTIGRLGSNVQTGLPSLAAGDVLGVAINSTDNEVQFYKNGSTVGSAVALPSTTRESFAFFVGATSRSSVFNFGQDSTFSGATTAGGNQDANGIGDFKYAPPSGFLSLCSASLPIPTIVDGSEHFNTVLYTGNSSTNAITGVGFQPDFLWLKARSSSGYDHVLQNVITGSTNQLYTNSTSAEVSDTDAITSFDTDGFTSGADVTTNNSGVTYASWNWKAGGTAVSNTAGSITSQVSANTDAGFSVVSYTGTGANATVGHGLDSAPEMVIVKGRSVAYSWGVYNKFVGANKYMYLENTTGAVTDTTFWNNLDSTDSVFNLGSEATVNQSSATYIAYCFANTDGYLKAGSYTGNGSTDGPFIYTGFRPAWLMIKRTDSANSWFVFDNQRDPYNFNVRFLNPNSDSAEGVGTNGYNDFLSNGFKIRASGTFANASGGTYIYLAFAENPFKYSNAR